MRNTLIIFRRELAGSRLVVAVAALMGYLNSLETRSTLPREISHGFPSRLRASARKKRDLNLSAACMITLGLSET